jgi:hypothetical protein
MDESPFLILDHIAEAADKLGLFITMKEGVDYYRGRGHIEIVRPLSKNQLINQGKCFPEIVY